ncbi:hypothetical protein KFK09_005746 [Dendrobium nobile]|uniref:Uncharacterized protein n=1 Tax=Dendrobium nobile TaxID=94219 RepID=A0A8T3BZ57_DENNO|nr:hypothetical protein KFK09_005746 [Dendrobium nobile]
MNTGAEAVSSVAQKAEQGSKRPSQRIPPIANPPIRPGCHRDHPWPENHKVGLGHHRHIVIRLHQAPQKHQIDP